MPEFNRKMLRETLYKVMVFNPQLLITLAQDVLKHTKDASFHTAQLRSAAIKKHFHASVTASREFEFGVLRSKWLVPKMSVSVLTESATAGRVSAPLSTEGQLCGTHQ